MKDDRRHEIFGEEALTQNFFGHKDFTTSSKRAIKRYKKKSSLFYILILIFQQKDPLRSLITKISDFFPIKTVDVYDW